VISTLLVNSGVGYPSDPALFNKWSALPTAWIAVSWSGVDSAGDTATLMNEGRACSIGFLLESLILAQDERWRRASYMQVERGPISGNTEEDLVANG
jgi:hypothetical protein